MDLNVFEQLHADGLIDRNTLSEIKAYENVGPLSVRWDILTMLYAGIILLTTGLGIVIYEHIDSIGHVAITTAIGFGMLLCFFYCCTKGKGFERGKVEQASIGFDYVVLTGCLLLLILAGYLQFQFGLFGQRWGLATFIPMVFLFTAAYYFDHIGVLSLAITNCAAWIGISVTPSRLLRDNDFNDRAIIYSAIGLGLVLLLVATWSNRQNIKRHFGFTYKNFSTHLLFVALIAALVVFSHFAIFWLALFAGVFYYHYTTAINEGSFYFLVVAALYFYAGISYVVIHRLFSFNSSGEGTLYITLLYLIGSALALVIFLMRSHKNIKQHASLH